jgi:hypothetical protein
MFGTIHSLVWTAIAAVAGVGGYLFTRNFVRHRLRFVDAARSPLAPIVAGAVAFGIGCVAALLPFVTLGTAVVFALGAGLGTASGARALQRGEWSQRQLTR